MAPITFLSDDRVYSTSSFLPARDLAVRALLKRSNWAGKNPGVIVVFCIVFLIAVGLISVSINKYLTRRRAAKAEAEII